jgi:hypothetical protein
MEQNFINDNQSQDELQQNPPYVANTNSSTSDSTYNSTQNTPPPEEPYNSAQNADKVQQYPAQPYPAQTYPAQIYPAQTYPAQPYPAQPYPAQPYPAQNMVVPPNQPYYPPQGATPIQPGVPINNYPLQPIALNVQPIPQNPYCKPYTLVQHKGILQTETNTYNITTGSCMKIIPFIMFFIGFVTMGFTAISLPETWIPFIFGLIFISCSIVFCCRMFHNIFIVLGPNNITVIQKAICNKRITIYNPGELERIEFTYNKTRSRNTGKRSRGYTTMHNYNIKAVRKNGSSDSILNVGSSLILFTQDEIEFFLYTVNTHIQTKMRV